MRKLLGLLSGIADSGFAAVANLGMGLFAVHTLATDDLAMYSLFFSGWVTAQLLPAQLAYLPGRLAINASESILSPRVSTDIRRGIVPITIAALGAAAAGLPLLSTTSVENYAVVAASVAVLTVVAPLQDHIRRSLHIVGKHSTAATCSATTCGTALILLAVVYVLGSSYSSAALAFGSLAVANLAGALLGMASLATIPRATYGVPRLVTRLGYLGPDFIGQAAGYLTGVITAGIIGTTAVASLETARIMSSPVIVIVAGLGAYMVPTTVRTFIRADLPLFRRRLLRMSFTILAAGAAYTVALVAAGEYLSKALGTHASGPLGASRSLVATLDASSSGSAFLLFTARRTVAWNVTSVIGSALTVACVVPSALAFGVFGVVLAQGIGAGCKSAIGISMSYRAHPPAPVTSV